MLAMNARQYNEQTMKGLFRKIYPVIAEQAIARTGIRSGLCVDLGGVPGPGRLWLQIHPAFGATARMVLLHLRVHWAGVRPGRVRNRLRGCSSCNSLRG